MIMAEVYDNFILSRRLANRSEKTISAYKQFVSPFLSWYGSEKPLDALQLHDIQMYIVQLLDRPISNATKATHIRHLKIFFKWCTEEYTVSYNYQKIKVPKSPKKRVTIYNPEQIRQLLDAVTAESEWLVLRNKAILCVMYDSGIRQGEVANLIRCRVDFDNMTMVVHGKGDKERTVPLGDTSAYIIQAYLEKCPYRSEFLFVGRRGEPITTNAIKLLVSKIAQKVPFDISSHKLRHNFGTNTCIDQYQQRGQMDVYGLKAIMGHESIKTTEGYMHHASEILASRHHISHLDLIGKKEIV